MQQCSHCCWVGMKRRQVKRSEPFIDILGMDLGLIAEEMQYLVSIARSSSIVKWGASTEILDVRIASIGQEQTHDVRVCSIV